MMAFKGFTPNLKSVMGDGKKETCHFVPGETKKVERSKTQIPDSIAANIRRTACDTTVGKKVVSSA